MEDQVLGRFRALTSGNAAGAAEGRAPIGREARAASPRTAERAAHEGEPRELEERREDDPTEAVANGPAPAHDPAARSASRGRAVDARGRVLAASDPNQAAGPAESAGSEPGLAASALAQAAALVGPAAAASSATLAAASAPPAGAAALAAPVQVGAQPTASHTPAIAGSAERQANRAAVAHSAPPPPAGPSAEDLARAESVLRQLRAKLTLGARDAVLELHPSELGKIAVHLRLEAGTLTATLRAERPETLAILEAHAPELRAWLAQDGVDVRELDLGLADAGFAFERPAQRDHAQNTNRRRAAEPLRPVEERAPARAPQQSAADSSGVDLVA